MRSQYPMALVAPLYYLVEDKQLCLVRESEDEDKGTKNKNKRANRG